MCKNKLHVHEHTQEENTDQHRHINYYPTVNIDSNVYITLAERGNLLKYEIIIVHSNFIFILEM